MSEKILLVDGHSIINRAFYGVTDLTNSEGLHTNAIFGFLNTLFKVLDEDIDDIMCTALEGGITYWCNRAEVVGDKYLGEYASEQISRGGELRLYDCESDAVYTLTLDKFLRGLATYVSGCYDIAVDSGRVDPGQIDAEGADCIIQYAIFDDVIYG